MHLDLHGAETSAGEVVRRLRMEGLAGEMGATHQNADHDEHRRGDRERHLQHPPEHRCFRFAVAQAKVEGVHRRAHGAVTTSPGARPEERSASRALCKMMTAAAWSTTSRRAREPTPTAARCPWAVTVDSRSSTTRTGTGSTAAAMAVAYESAVCAAAPRAPDIDRGSPTTTSIALCLATRSAILARSARFAAASSIRRTVSTGDARTAAGSLTATPTRTLPTSMPSRTPGRMSGGVSGRIARCIPGRTSVMTAPRCLCACGTGRSYVGGPLRDDPEHSPY